MIHMTKLYVGLLLAICTFEFIDASCLSYGHSCWGAHGKRSYNAQQESRPGEQDRWALFKIFPEKNEGYQVKDVPYRVNQQAPYSGNDIRPQIYPIYTSLEEIPQPDDRILRRPIESPDEDFQQKHMRMDNIKPFQPLRLNSKPNFDQ